MLREFFLEPILHSTLHQFCHSDHGKKEDGLLSVAKNLLDIHFMSPIFFASL